MVTDISNLSGKPLLRASLRRFFVGLSDSVKYFPATLQLAWRSSPALISAILITTVILSFIPMCIAYIGKLLVDAVASKQLHESTRFVAIEFGFATALLFFQRCSNLAKALVGAKLIKDVNFMVLSHAQTFSYPCYEDPAFYDQLTRARRESNSRPLNMLNDGMNAVQNGLTFFGYLSLLYTFNGYSVVFLLLAAVPVMLAETRFAANAFRIRNSRSSDTRRLQYIEHVLATDSHQKEIKVNQVGNYFLDKYKAFSELFYAEDSERAVSRAVWGGGLALFGVVVFFACYLTLAKKGVAGEISIGLFSMYVIAFRQGQQSLGNCLSMLSNMYEHNLYMANFFSFLAIKPQSQIMNLPRSTFERCKEKGLRLANVSFRYPHANHTTLKDINLFIPNGKSLGVVGQNGAGKSTLIKLLCGLYEPTSGEILLDSVPIKDWEPQLLAKRFGVVFQDFNRYQMTLAENIALGDISRLNDRKVLERAISLSGVNSFISELPLGLGSQLGKWFLEGSELSGGQWQRVALARAFVKGGADILILDEPTSALDPSAERALFSQIKELSVGRTLILISHRFPAVRITDCIVVLEGGKVAESGAHDTLVQKGGQYSRMFHSQAEGYL